MLIIEGHTLAVVPRAQVENGYKDMDHDDYHNGDFLHDWQEKILSANPRVKVRFFLARAG